MKPVYIQDVAGFLPNAPVSNEAMESVLGQVGDKPSRARRVVLRSNGIRSRHYAIDPDSGEQTHSNAALAAEAVRRLASGDIDLQSVELLSCGTSSPDQLMPGHGVMVHGELGNPTCEVASLSGICIAGVNALRYASLAVAAGQVRTAVTTASELASSFMRAGMFAVPESGDASSSIERQPERAFHSDFLRWMLSDGAGAMLLSDKPAPAGASLRLDWIEQFSFANRMPVCMYAGAEKTPSDTLRGWREYANPAQAAAAGSFNVKQDVRLLNDHIAQVCFREGIEHLRSRRALEADTFDHFVAHYSSEYFRAPLRDSMQAVDFVIPESRWFSCLPAIGNVGSASIYLHLAEMLRRDLLSPGERILCFVPESGRFSTALMQLSVVDNAG